MRIKQLAVLLLFFVFINSCKTDFDIIAPYKETTVVYGLLNPSHKTQYIKVNKAFLGQGDALVMAQQFDSTNYPPGVLDVKLQRLDAGQVVETLPLDAALDSSKEPGIFSNPYQILYKTKLNAPLIRPGSTYNLVIYNSSNQNTLSSSTPVVDTLAKGAFTHPRGAEAINLTGVPTAIYQTEFTAVKNARLYNLVIRFLYTEKQIGDPNPGKSRYVDWDQGLQKSQRLNGAEQIVFAFNRTDFYRFLANQLPVDPTIQRTRASLPIEFMITYAGDDLSTYIDVNQPSTGIVQDRPEYSNISNGIGIFSSRSSINLFHDMDQPSKDSLRSRTYITKDLNFQ